MNGEATDSYELLVLLMMTVRYQLDELHRRMAEIGYPDLRPAHGIIFQLLALKNGATGNEIAEHLGVTKQAASQMLDFLQKQGYITRQPLPGDARGKLVRLSDKGWRCIRESERIMVELENKMGESLGPDSLANFRIGLRHFMQQTHGGSYPILLKPIW